MYWSLCVEEHFYLLWPIFLCLVRRTRVRVAVSLALCLTLPVLRHLAVASGWDQPLAVHYASHYRLDSILWGGLAALVASRIGWRDWTRRLLLGAGAILIASLLVTNSMSVRPIGRPIGFSLGFSLLALTTAILLLELTRRPSTWLARSLEFRPLVAVGRVWYGMYLLHLPVMDLAMIVLFAVPTATNHRQPRGGYRLLLVRHFCRRPTAVPSGRKALPRAQRSVLSLIRTRARQIRAEHT